MEEEDMGMSTAAAPLLLQVGHDEPTTRPLSRRFLEESKLLWRVVGPGIVSRTTSYATSVISQSFAGHLGDLELAALSVAINVIVGFTLGLMLGMASALETLCGQAFGAKRPHLLGIYMQRSWIVLFLCAVALVPVYLLATPILRWAGQPEEIAELSGRVAVWVLPVHFSFAFLFPLTRFLQCQMRNAVTALTGVLMLAVHVPATWLLVYRLRLGLLGIALVLDFSWWFYVLSMLVYAVCGGCPSTWTGLSAEAFAGLWDFLKLSVSSGVMLCLENWYYKILVLVAGTLKNAEVAVDALSICMNINAWELMIPLAFFAGTGVRVANELGAGNGKGAKFAAIVSVATSLAIGFFFFSLIMVFHDKFALFFTNSTVVLQAVDHIAILLAFTILFNSVQPILSGVAVGSGWQATVAYINIGSYYMVGIPLGLLLGWVFDLGILGIWSGMVGGTVVQTLILSYITLCCNWDEEALKASKAIHKWDNVK